MKGKKLAKMCCLTLASMMMFSSLSLDGFALQVRTTSNTQMQSDEENVYLNTYANTKREANFNANWKFHLGEQKGAEANIFDDSKWDIVSVPHDYSIIQNYQPTLEAESAYLPGGIGWYRKYFTLDKDVEGKRIRLDFDGVYNNATVYVNGKEVGMHPYGYTPFSFDITDLVTTDGKENVIAVKVNHQTPSSRWYSGSGIYRDVNLTITNPVHVALHGQAITTPNLASEVNNQVTMNLATKVNNASDERVDVSLKHTIYKKGNENEILGTYTSNARQVEANSIASIETSFKTTTAPKLWSTQTPNLYVVKTEVVKNGEVVDTIYEDYGFRWFSLDPNKGAFLNGEAIKIQGVCLHHDQGSLGAAAYYDAIYRQVKIMKDMGVNSIRVTHNPASQVLIDICNQEGILLVDEIFDGWMNAKNENKYDFSMWFNKEIAENNAILGKEDHMTWAEFEIKNTIYRGKNNPSIIMYSLGNEIQEGTKAGGYRQKAPELIAWAKEADANCLLTVGSNQLKNDGPNGEHTFIADKLDEVDGAVGTNYSKADSYTRLHNDHPSWNLYGSETASAVNSRGIYTSKGTNPLILDANKQLTSYDQSKVNWGETENQAWYDVIKRDYVFGEYVWTGFDYLGEPTPANGIIPGAQGSWPSPKNSYFGIVDTAGFEKDSYYFYQSQWNDEVNTLHILPTWNRDSLMIENGKVEVVVYSDADRVELYLNDQKVGTQDFETVTTENGHTYKHKVGKDTDGTDLFSTFKIDYQEGTLSCKAYKKVGNDYVLMENTQGRSTVKTTSTKAKLMATTSKTEMVANNEDLAYIEVDITDENGNIIPNASDVVTFEVSGEGVLVGVDNGNSSDHQSYQDDNRKAHAGKVLAIVKATRKEGNIQVVAKANGLEEAVVNITTVKDANAPTTKTPLSYRMNRNLYVKQGHMPELPKNVEITYTDGSKERVDVKWEAISDELINKVGSFTVFGKAGQVDVSINVNMISNVAALMNYSTTVRTGTNEKDFKLPTKREVILEDGTILPTAFDVVWDEIPSDAFDKASSTPIKIKGKANIFGQEKEVVASIRVQDVTYQEGVNIAPQAHLEELDNAHPSDTLQAITNGRKDFVSSQTSPNPNVWTNYNNSQQGDDTAEILFKYDTQQTISKIEVTFFRDNHAARFPHEDDVKFFVDEKPLVCTGVQATNKPTSGAGTSTYTFTFAPVLVTQLKMQLKNSNETLNNGSIKPCTGITEVVIKSANEKFTTGTSANLTSLTLNGRDYDKDSLATGKIYTSAIVANIENIVTSDNASVTVVQTNQDIVKLIIDSEDGKTRNVFNIYLGKEFENLKPTDASKDLPNDRISEVIAGSEQNSDNSKEHVRDNNVNTIWHTSWDHEVSKEDLWVGYNFKDVETITGLRYLPRQNQDNNGIITSFKVQYKASDDDTWHDATLLDENAQELQEGSWPNNKAWKSVNIKEVKAKQIRLLGIHSVGDNPSQKDKYASCAELRIVAREAREDINHCDVLLEGVTNGIYEVVEPQKPKVTVKNGEQVLAYGIDYKLTYENTDTFNKNAKVIVEGIGAYEGSKTIVFEMKQTPQVISAIAYVEKSCKQQYVEKEHFDPTGLQLRLVHNYGKDEVVTYSKENADQFKFSISLDQPLELTDNQVTVTYKGQQAIIPLTVTLPTVQKDQLETLIKQAEKVSLSNVTAESKKAFIDALNDARSVLNDGNATQKTVNDAYDQLQFALDHLETVVVDKTKLQSLIDHIQKTNLDYSKFTEASMSLFNEQLAYAKDILAKENVTMDEVNAAYEKLNEAWLLLELKDENVQADKSKLEALIKKASEMNLEGCTQSSIQHLQEVLQLAKEMLANPKVSQAQVDLMVDTLQEAINNLNRPVTGDSMQLGGYIASIALAGLAMYIISRKKKESRG